MKILLPTTLQSLKDYVTQHCRPLEAAYLGFLLGETAVAPFVAELHSFQNPDGGFGHGLEPDFWLPDSSPMAFRGLTGLPVDKQLPLIQRGIDFKDLVSIQLDALVEEIEQTGFCAPTWNWGGDDANWQKARQWGSVF